MEVLLVLACAACAYLVYKDAKDYLLPNKVTVPFILAGLVYSYLAGNMKNALLGMVVTGGIFLWACFKGGAGGGDLKMAAGIGAWFGYPDGLWIIVIACLLGVVWGLTRIKREEAFARLFLVFNGFLLRFQGIKGVLPMKGLPEDPRGSRDVIPFGVFMGLVTIGYAAVLLKGSPMFIAAVILFLAAFAFFVVQAARPVGV